MDVAEKIAQPFAYIHVCKLAAAHEGVDDGGILGGIMVPAEEIPFSSDGQWADTVLDVVVVYLVPAVVDIPRQLADVAEQIVDGLADGTLGQHAAGLVERPSLQCPDDGVRQFPSQAGTLPIVKMPTVGQGLYAVEHADLVKGVLGTLLVMCSDCAQNNFCNQKLLITEESRKKGRIST